MADTVASTTIQDGVRTSVLRFTNVSDGTGESEVVKVDASALAAMTSGSKSTNIKIMRCWWSISGMDVDMLFDASTNILALSLTSDGAGYLDFTSFGGLPNTAGSGKTGDILFTTRNHTSGDTYTIILEVQKG
tara:strand:- start:1783 stop:2181 length:399 start_codon:yes stop_codon:yes gene_type:complete